MNGNMLNRTLHRDIAYFYVGLIISFSISGIALNHRRDWSPMNYTYEMREIRTTLPEDPSQITQDFVDGLVKDLEITNDIRGFRTERGLLRIFLTDGLAELSLETGDGQVEFYKKRPVLGQMTLLHVTTDSWWIWYSDIFGVAMLTIAVTGMFISKGSNSFAKRGWKFALVGIVFPLAFLFFIA